MPPFDYPVWIRLAKDGLTVIVEYILPSLVMSGHYFTSRAPNCVIAVIVKAPVSTELFNYEQSKSSKQPSKSSFLHSLSFLKLRQHCCAI